VDGEDNPADAGTRGLTPKELIAHPLWVAGPRFLKTDPDHWPVLPPPQVRLTQDAEDKSTPFLETEPGVLDSEDRNDSTEILEVDRASEPHKSSEKVLAGLVKEPDPVELNIDRAAQTDEYSGQDEPFRFFVLTNDWAKQRAWANVFIKFLAYLRLGGKAVQGRTPFTKEDYDIAELRLTHAAQRQMFGRQKPRLIGQGQWPQKTHWHQLRLSLLQREVPCRPS
jgi:hypothetical protein